MSHVKLDVSWLKRYTLEYYRVLNSTLQTLTKTITGFDTKGNALNRPTLNAIVTTLDDRSQRHQESLCQLNGTLNNLTKNNAALYIVG